MTNPTVPSHRSGLLAALRYPNYRYLWGTAIGIVIATSMEAVAIGWLVLELTNSPSMVGLVAAFRWVGMGLGPFLGTLVDRFNRRRILIVLRVASGGYALTLAILYYTSLLAVWHIFILVLLIGILNAFDFTTSNTIIPDTVTRHDLLSAVSILMIGMSIARMIGPLIGGYLFEKIGASGSFTVIAVTYLSTCLLLFSIRIPKKEQPIFQESVWRNMIGGIKHIVNDQALLALIIMAAVANLFAFPVVFGIMPVFARDVLHMEASGLGQLMAIEGLGGLIGALIILVLGRFRRKGWLVIIALITWTAFLGFFAGSHYLPLSLVLLVGAGIGRGLTFGMIQILLLTWAPDEIRGRVMGLRIFAVVTMPVGSILLGVGANLWGIANVIIISSLSGILTTILIALRIPELHRRQ